MFQNINNNKIFCDIIIYKLYIFYEGELTK